jgi:hypothetical protein
MIYLTPKALAQVPDTPPPTGVPSAVAPGLPLTPKVTGARYVPVASLPQRRPRVSFFRGRMAEALRRLGEWALAALALAAIVAMWFVLAAVAIDPQAL